eukprot:jgi/Tetstr1/439843/TSEL_028254.t1
MQEATPAQLTFLEGELARFVESGAWEFGTCRSMETLLGVRPLTKKGDYMFSFDLQDGFYALGIAEVDRDYFTVDVRGQLYMLAGLPMGRSLSPYYFVTLTQRNPTKGFWEPCQVGTHLGVDIDSASGMFYAPADNLNRLSRQATRKI